MVSCQAPPDQMAAEDIAPAETRKPALEGSTGFLVGRAHRALRSSWELRLADLGLSAPQAAALRAAGSQPNTGLRALARLLGTDPMNVRRLVGKLNQRGLVELKTSSSDARIRVIVVTERGAQMVEEIGRRAEEQEHHLLAVLGAEGHLRLRLQLQRLAAEFAKAD